MAPPQQISKAERFLRTAHLALEDGDADSCVSRAYYAVFHAVILLLRVRSDIVRGRWDHVELQFNFQTQFCDRGFLSFSRRDLNVLTELYKERLNADYGLEAVSKKRAERLLGKAEALVAEIRRSVGYG